MEISGGIDICQMSFPTGATAILLLVCILSLLSTKCPAASILRSARFSSMQTTKKPHGYHKIAVWQKDDRIRKSPLKFYAQYYSILSGDFQALIITELWRHIYCFICYFSISSANLNWDFMYSNKVYPLSRTLWLFLFRFLFYICLLCRGIKVMPLIDCFYLLL